MQPDLIDCLNELKSGANKLPKNLDTEGFRAAWELWTMHRNEIKKPLTKTAKLMQLKKLSEWGEKRAIAAIVCSIEKEWQGIYEARELPQFEPKQTAISGAERVQMNQELERVLEQMKLIRATYGDHQSWTKDDVELFKKLRTRRDELKQKLGVQL